MHSVVVSTCSALVFSCFFFLERMYRWYYTLYFCLHFRMNEPYHGRIITKKMQSKVEYPEFTSQMDEVIMLLFYHIYIISYTYYLNSWWWEYRAGWNFREITFFRVYWPNDGNRLRRLSVLTFYTYVVYHLHWTYTSALDGGAKKMWNIVSGLNKITQDQWIRKEHDILFWNDQNMNELNIRRRIRSWRSLGV